MENELKSFIGSPIIANVFNINSPESGQNWRAREEYQKNGAKIALMKYKIKQNKNLMNLRSVTSFIYNK